MAAVGFALFAACKCMHACMHACICMCECTSVDIVTVSLHYIPHLSLAYF